MAVPISSIQQLDHQIKTDSSTNLFANPSSSVDPMLKLSAGIGGAIFLFVFSALKIGGYFPNLTPQFEYALGMIIAIVALATTLPNTWPNLQFLKRDLKQLSISVEGASALAFALLYVGIVCAAFDLSSGQYLQIVAGNLIVLNLVSLVQQRILNPMFDKALGELEPGKTLGEPSELLARVELKSGDLVCCDGVVEDGVATVQERGLGPNATERFKLKGDKLFAGTRVTQGNLRYRVEVSAAESTITYFLAHLRGVLSEISAIGTQRWAKSSGALNAILLLALFGAISLGVSDEAPLKALLVGTSLLTIANVLLALPLIDLLRKSFIVKLFFAGALIRSEKTLALHKRIKNLVLDSVWTFGKARLVKFQLLDNRLDEKGLKLALVNIFARMEEEPFRALGEELSKGIGRIDPLNVTNFQVYKSDGVSASISGAEFSVGNEDFLIERGVYLQASELNAKHDKIIWYVALNDELVGYMNFELGALGYASGVARRFGVGTKLFSLETPSNVDLLSDELGLKYDDLMLGLTPQVYREKLMTLKPVALLASDRIPERAQEFADLTIGNFDRLTFHLTDWDITLFDRSLNAAQRTWKTLRLAARIEQFFWVATYVVGVGLLFGAWFGLGPWAVAVVVLALHYAILRTSKSLLGSF